MDTFDIKVKESDIGKRIDSFLAENFENFSRTYIQDLIKKGKALVNGKGIKANCRLRSGDKVIMNIPKPEPVKILPENIPLDILYEDNDVILVNKPKGMVVHPAAGHYSKTLVNALLHHCKGNLSGINGVLRPGIVHRIDMDTTGVIIVCKNDKSHQCIADQLAEHSVNRKYVAIVSGNLKNDEGTIDAPIARSKKDRKKMAVDNTGKRAVTHYRVLERFQNCTYIECILETGRTHQIRVHMAYIHHPLVGDNVYGGDNINMRLRGQCLHAKSLGFIHPTTHKYMEFEALMPQYFSEILEKLKKQRLNCKNVYI